MIEAPFNLNDSLIVYGADNRATQTTSPPAELAEAHNDCIMGIFELADDESVHADHWECHPSGDEILCVLEGRLLVAVDRGGGTEEVVIGKGQAFIVPQGSWHRQQVLEPGQLLFFTPAGGTELRPYVPAELDA